jgi:FixJ family two-component response regulator
MMRSPAEFRGRTVILTSLLSSLPVRSETRRVLIVDDEQHILSTLPIWLDPIGWQAVCANTIAEALKISYDPTLTLALIDYRLSSGDQGIRLGRVLQQRRGLPFVLISGHLCPTVVVRAMKAGALDVLEKPLTENSVQEFLRTLAWNRNQGNENLRPHVDHAVADGTTARWSKMILKACHSGRDPRTISTWATAIGLSPTTIDETCRLCGVKAYASRDIARFLRALSLSKTRPSLLRSHFAIADKRTLENLFRRAGIPFDSKFIDLQTFFRTQTLIGRTKPCLKDLAHRCANSQLFF